MVERPRLFVLPPSHYCERARWALDHVALEYQEEPLAVGLHVLRARSMAKATTLPILTSGLAIIQGSGAILDFVGMTGGASELDWFEAELAGRQYLVGERFGRADLTAASLLGPLARPRECPIYGRVRLPEYLEQSLDQWSNRPSLRWVKYMYATHRQRSQVIDLSRPPK